MKTTLVTTSTLGLLIGVQLVIGIMFPRFQSSRDDIPDKIFALLQKNQMDGWSEEARRRWVDVVEAPAKKRRKAENLIALSGGLSALISAGILAGMMRDKGARSEHAAPSDGDKPPN